MSLKSNNYQQSHRVRHCAFERCLGGNVFAFMFSHVYVSLTSGYMVPLHAHLPWCGSSLPWGSFRLSLESANHFFPLWCNGFEATARLHFPNFTRKPYDSILNDTGSGHRHGPLFMGCLNREDNGTSNMQRERRWCRTMWHINNIGSERVHHVCPTCQRERAYFRCMSPK